MDTCPRLSDAAGNGVRNKPPYKTNGVGNVSIKAVAHISQVRGGSQARIMLADDGKKYVVKFQNLCGAPHKFCNVENSVMWSWFPASRLCGVFRQSVSTLLRGL